MTISIPRNHAEVVALLRAADPVADVDLRAPRLAAALDGVGDAIVLRAPTRPAGRRRAWARRVLIITVLALAVAVGGAAAAGWFTNAHTGRYPRHAWEVTAGGPGEALNIAGTNFRQVAAQVTADIRFPAGYAAWRSWVFSTVSPGAQTCPRGSTRHCISTVSTGALRGWVAMGAFCAWTVDWRQAMAAGARARAVTDAAVIGSAPRCGRSPTCRRSRRETAAGWTPCWPAGPTATTAGAQTRRLPGGSTACAIRGRPT